MNFTDQIGHSIELHDFPPKRIISLVPSQTELLCHLGCDANVIGITKFCTHPPEWKHTKNIIGGTKTLNIARIESLNPDLIVGNKEENEQAQILYMRSKYPVWLSDICNLEDALWMIGQIGEMTHKTDPAQKLIQDIELGFKSLHTSWSQERLRVAYLIWRKPFMAAGAQTFIHNMLEWAGFDNVFSDLARYPEVDAETLAHRQPQVVMLSSEPYPFSEKHLAEVQEYCPKATILLVDGVLFSWFGSRLLQAPPYFKKLRESLLNGMK